LFELLLVCNFVFGYPCESITELFDSTEPLPKDGLHLDQMSLRESWIGGYCFGRWFWSPFEL